MRDPKEIILSKGQTLEHELMEDCPDLSGADLRGADLRWADLRRTDLSNANLYGSNLCDANLTRANLYRANLYRANLTMANLYRADLCDANLTMANLYGSNLYGSNLYFAGLSEAENIISIGPIGPSGDILYAVRWDNGPMISMDVFWGSPEELEEYIAKSNPVDEYHRAIEFIRAWGK